MTDDEILVAVMDFRAAYQRARAAEHRLIAAEALVREEAAAVRACWDEVYRIQGLLQVEA